MKYDRCETLKNGSSRMRSTVMLRVRVPSGHSPKRLGIGLKTPIRRNESRVGGFLAFVANKHGVTSPCFHRALDAVGYPFKDPFVVIGRRDAIDDLELGEAGGDGQRLLEDL